MRFSRDNGQAGRFGLVTAIAAIYVTLALVAPAGAETTEPAAAAAAPATETPAAAEEVQAAPVETVEGDLAPSAAAEPADAEEVPGASDAPVAAPAESGETAPSPPTSPASLPDEPASQAPGEFQVSGPEPQASGETAPDSAVASAGRRASEFVDAVRQAARAPAPVVEHAAETLGSQAPLESTVRMASSSAELLSRAATPVREVLGGELVATPASDSIVPLASGAVGFDPPTSAGRGASAVSRELGGLAAGERIRGLIGHALATYSGAHGRIESLRRAAPHGPARSADSSPAATTAIPDASHSRVATGLPNDPHPDRPAPPSESPGAASGSGGSFFVPLAALLALLALAAPATLRRLREVPDLLAPAPFVCALERPG